MHLRPYHLGVNYFILTHWLYICIRSENKWHHCWWTIHILWCWRYFWYVKFTLLLVVYCLFVKMFPYFFRWCYCRINNSWVLKHILSLLLLIFFCTTVYIQYMAKMLVTFVKCMYWVTNQMYCFRIACVLVLL